MKKKNLIIFGILPKVIKMASLFKTLQKHSENFEIKVFITTQYRKMLNQVLAFFEIAPDYDLDFYK